MYMMRLKWVMLALVLLAILLQRSSYAQDFKWNVLSIDCGAATERSPQPSIWRQDEEFIGTGQNRSLSGSITPLEMASLRFFPDGNKNCYDLPLHQHKKYLLRAGFYYGNYDDLSDPPNFDLEINGQRLTNITTSLSQDPLYVEWIYPTTYSDGRVELCLVRTGAGVPFISSLEMISLPDEFYRLMDNFTILSLRSRTFFVGDGDVGIPSESVVETYNRIWKLRKMGDYDMVNATRIPAGIGYETENKPPADVIANAITPRSGSDAIVIPVEGTPLPSPPAYFVLYFKEPDKGRFINYSRKIQIRVNGNDRAKIDVPPNSTSVVASLYPVLFTGYATVMLVEADGSTAPPIINAMEVFTSMTLTGGVGRPGCYASIVLAIGVSILFGRLT